MSTYNKLVYSNTCDIHNSIYHNGFEQRLYLPESVLLPIYEITKEEGRGHEDDYSQNGGTFTKKYEMQLGAIPEYLLDCLHEASCCDSIRLFLTSDEFIDIKDLQIEYEWITECYALTTLKFVDATINKFCCDNFDLNTEPILRSNCEIMQWIIEITDAPGISGTHLVVTFGFPTGNVVIDWGDGTTTTGATGLGHSHTYAEKGVYWGKAHHQTDGNYNAQNITFYTYENTNIIGWDLGGCYDNIRDIALSFQSSVFPKLYCKKTWTELRQLTISNSTNAYLNAIIIPDEILSHIYHLWGIAVAIPDLEPYLVAMDSTGILNGSIDFIGGTTQGFAALSATALAARASLLGKGWSITLNP